MCTANFAKSLLRRISCVTNSEKSEKKAKKLAQNPLPIVLTIVNSAVTITKQYCNNN